MHRFNKHTLKSAPLNTRLPANACPFVTLYASPHAYVWQSTNITGERLDNVWAVNTITITHGVILRIVIYTAVAAMVVVSAREERASLGLETHTADQATHIINTVKKLG